MQYQIIVVRKKMRWRERASGVRMSEGCHGSSDWTSFAFGKSPGLLSPLDNLERPSHAGVDLILTIMWCDRSEPRATLRKCSGYSITLLTILPNFLFYLRLSLRTVKIVVFKEEMSLKVYTALLLPGPRRLYVPLFIFI